MKCDLCKREPAGRQMLCDTCSEAVQRLLLITRKPAIDETPLAQRAAVAFASVQ